MTPELEATFQVLKATRNTAAVPVLVFALDEPDADIQQAALNALLARRTRRGQLAVVSRLDRLAPSVRQQAQRQAVLLDCGIRDGLASGDPRLQENAAQLLTQANDFGLARLLICCLVEGNAYTRQVAMTALRALLARYRELVEQAASGQAPPVDLDHARRTLVTALGKGVDGFASHRETGILEELLSLEGPSHDQAADVLSDPRHPAHGALLGLLSTTSHPQVIRWLFDLLRDERTGDEALRILTSRHDGPFLKLLLSQVHLLSDARVSARFRRVRELPWLDFGNPQVRELGGRQQASAIILASQLGWSPSQKRTLYAKALAVGEPEARRAAICALGHLTGPEADDLILRHTEDGDPQVKVAATREALARQLSEATTLAVRHLDSDNPVVRAGARSALARFDFEKYWRSFDRMDASKRRQAGQLIEKIDPMMKQHLTEALQSDEKAERFRAVKMAQALGVDSQLEPHIVKLTQDPDSLVRATAIRALEGVVSHAAAEAVGAALSDRDGRVRGNAVETLYSLDDPRTAEVFRTMAADPVQRVRVNAALGLFKLGHHGECMAVFSRMLASRDVRARTSAVWGAFRTQSEEGLRLARHALRTDPSAKVRQFAVRLFRSASAPAPGAQQPVHGVSQ